MNNGERYLSVKQLAERHSTSIATVWRRARTDASFPKPVRMSPGCTRWRLSDIERWEAARAASAA
ncbi:hypothetical protein BLTE_15180 [Blastochloris tepida]|uniref:AlpA family phage regulatory protein n=1 Tax=Blastochloris tepida TaxID=2233851 RepID=A0A348FZV0_9HYPH|nr:hypothetical protein BLTE_15180 [Blastochloris tepida]